MKRFDTGLLALLATALCSHYLHLVPAAADNYLLIALSVAGTVPMLVSAFVSVKEKKISVDLLASIALVASLLAREWDSAAFINLMLTSARLFGYYTENKARAAIDSLLKLRPDEVNVKRDGQTVTVPIARVAIGDIVVVESGGRIAVDGVVEDGQASVDQSSLTGESVPVARGKGDEVYSSTLAVSGSLLVRVTKIGKDTTLEKIVALVESSEREKAGIRTVADTFASWYIGLTFIGAIVVFAVFRDVNLVLSLLLVVCADDIAVGIPLAFLAAMGYAARRGVIIKGGAYLEALPNVTTLIVDKTGTVTQGLMAVEQIMPLDGYSEREFLALAGAVESISGHPIAKSIVHRVAKEAIVFGQPETFHEYPGKGTVAVWDGKTIVAGKETFLAEQGVALPPTDLVAVRAAKERGLTVTLFAVNRKLVGFIGSADAIRPEVKAAIQRLKQLGVERIVMLTGDTERVARKMAEDAGITEYHAGLLPQDKLQYLKDNIAHGRTLAMVGDGVNDAASLALADVGIAMGVIGSDAAIEAADIALMKDDFGEIPKTMELGRYTRKIARQDFWIWGITNAIGLVLVFARVIGPEGAAAFNFITDFFPLANSMRLFSLHATLRK